MSGGRPGPGALWYQAGGDAERFRELMRENGHIADCECPCHADGSGHCDRCRPRLRCGWPEGSGA